MREDRISEKRVVVVAQNGHTCLTTFRSAWNAPHRTANRGLGSVFRDFLCDCAVGLDNNLVETLRCLDRVGLLIYPFKLLESTTPGLNAIEGSISIMIIV